jgi:D-alanine--poly(phosphoribitol) ligase subunit 2
MTAPLVIARVIAALKANVQALHAIDLQPETELLSMGLLDSFEIVNLVPVLEATFDVAIDLEQVELEVFESAAALARFVESRLARHGRPA